MRIDQKSLEKARKQCFLLKDIREELEHGYNSYHSPNLTEVRGKSYENADPTVQAVHKIERLRELYDRVRGDFLDYQFYVMDRVDPVIRPLITMYYFCGMSWKDTGYSRARKRVSEYLIKHEEELNR